MMTYVISNIAAHSQEEQPITVYGQDTMERILEHEGEAETPPVPQTPRQTTLEGKRSGCMWPHCPSPSPVQCSTTPRSLPLSLQFLQCEKRALGGHTACPALWVTSWQPLLQSNPTRVAGECTGLDHWESDCNNQHSGLGRQNSYMQHPNCSPTSSSAHLKIQLGTQSDQWTQQCAGLSDSGPQTVFFDL